MFNYGYGYNPMINAQQRANLMEQQSTGLTTIPITDIAEANAYRVDINGTPTLFYNAGKGEVYLKRTNIQTGLADFIIFKKEEVKQEKQPDKFKILSDKIDGLYAILDNSKTKKAIKDVE